MNKKKICFSGPRLRRPPHPCQGLDATVSVWSYKIGAWSRRRSRSTAPAMVCDRYGYPGVRQLSRGMSDYCRTKCFPCHVAVKPAELQQTKDNRNFMALNVCRAKSATRTHD
jgi:hypothetical protein